MERLTQRYDNGFAEDEITYCNPSDPEGLYNIVDLARRSADGDVSETDLLFEISRRLAAYEDTGLTPQEIMDGKLLTGWIPVSERLPEDSKPVYAYAPVPIGTKSVIDATTGMMVKAHRYTGYTHWMPRFLPQPPKEGK